MHHVKLSRHARLAAAIAGAPVDRLPCTAWFHFGVEHLSGAQAAWLHEQFFRAYDWDLLKVMGDHRFAVPEQTLRFDTAPSIRAIASPTEDAPCFREQQHALSLLRARLGTELPLIDSGYSPYQMLLRNIGRDQAAYLWTHQQATLDLLEQICAAICAHIGQLKRLGVDGYFHATDGAIAGHMPGGVSEAVYERFVRPFDLAILKAAEGMVRVLHAHGNGIALDRLHGYPFEILHLSDRSPDNPDLAELRAWTGRCLMGGIDECSFTAASLEVLSGQMSDALARAGRQGLILAPGCVLSPSCSGRSLRFIRSFAGATLLLPDTN